MRGTRRRAVRALTPVLIMGALLLQGCATAPMSENLLQQPPEGLVAQKELTSVPFFPQARYQCGPAALATVLNHWQHPVTPEALVPEVYLPEREGSLPLEMKAAARQRGFITYPLAPSLTDLMREIDAGNPVLVLQNLSIDWFPQWHYAVVVGYDLKARHVVLRSGRLERRITDLSTFERTWQRADHWALVITPPDRIPFTAKPLPFLTAASEMASTGRPEAAEKAYQAAAQLWPDHPLTLMAQGNRLFADGNYERAADRFRRLITHQPDKAYAWNNLAYSLDALRCPSLAQKAAQCAVSLAPQDANIQDTLQELGAGNAKGGGNCAQPALPLCPQDPGTALSN